jgi:hypothetical protein
MIIMPDEMISKLTIYPLMMSVQARRLPSAMRGMPVSAARPAALGG